MGSHFLKDKEGNYHEYSEEEYQEKRAVEFGTNLVALSCGLITGGCLGVYYGIIESERSLLWVGIILFALGAALLKYLVRNMLKYLLSLFAFIILAFLIVWIFGDL